MPTYVYILVTFQRFITLSALDVIMVLSKEKLSQIHVIKFEITHQRCVGFKSRHYLTYTHKNKIKGKTTLESKTCYTYDLGYFAIRNQTVLLLFF